MVATETESSRQILNLAGRCAFPVFIFYGELAALETAVVEVGRAEVGGIAPSLVRLKAHFVAWVRVCGAKGLSVC